MAQLQQQYDKEPRTVTQEEITSILKSQPFNNFFNKSSKMIEKALYR